MNININGVTYSVDLDKAIKDGYLKPQQPIAVGDFFKYTPQKGEPYSSICVLVSTDFNTRQKVMVALVSLTNGNRFHSPIQVECPTNIREDEWKMLIGCAYPDQFVPIRVKITEVS